MTMETFKPIIDIKFSINHPDNIYDGDLIPLDLFKYTIKTYKKYIDIMGDDYYKNECDILSFYTFPLCRKPLYGHTKQANITLKKDRNNSVYDIYINNIKNINADILSYKFESRISVYIFLLIKKFNLISELTTNNKCVVFARNIYVLDAINYYYKYFNNAL